LEADKAKLFKAAAGREIDEKRWDLDVA